VTQRVHLPDPGDTPRTVPGSCILLISTCTGGIGLRVLAKNETVLPANVNDKLIDDIVAQVLQRLRDSGKSPAGDSGNPGGEVTDDIRAGRVRIGVSARHCHLSPEHVETLFGSGSKLTVFRNLLQPGEFACEQQVTLVSPAGRCLGPVRVLGPERKTSQVEISLTDGYALGLKKMPPIRPSGDHRDSVGITLVGPAGAVTLTSGLIRANRHVHLHTAQAAAIGLKDNDIVNVRVEGDRPLLLIGCQLRAKESFRAEIHLDTDDANAAGVRSGDVAQIILG
jgi:putative phosphotransacetylase